MKKIFAEVNRLLDIAGILGTQLKDAEQQLTAAQNKWEAESPALIKELRKAEAEANRLQKNLDQLYKRLDAIEKLLSGVLKPDRRADLEREKTALKQSIAEMSDRLAAISARINDIKAALERMQREIDKWTNATKTLRKDIAVVEAQLRILSRIQNDMVDKHTKMLNTWARQIAACKDRE
jgi:chromosome segregation ATPase